MTDTFTTRLTQLCSDEVGLRHLKRGIEKESLRIDADGALARTPHPRALGSPLTHPSITTDFSESQLELITGVHETPQACLQELEQIHQLVYANLDNERLWPSSMPCLVGEDSDIPIGVYGTSNIGMAKTVYRRGLGVRYGRLMQTISGIHYNFSLPETVWNALNIVGKDAKTAAYFGLIRNFRRWSWLLLYLFGASPAVCRSFTRNLQHNLQPFDEGSLHLPYATSLRMGPLGYQSNAQGSLHISYNTLEEYAQSMEDALTTEYPPYAHQGIMRDGEYQQLSTSILQIENEFYGTIRPKRTIESGERPISALRARGVEYVEVRCIDLNPFLPVGIDVDEVGFLDCFLLLCLLADSPPDSVAESGRMSANQLAVVERGREPGLQLSGDQGEEVELTAWAMNLIDQCQEIAVCLDRVNGTDRYAATCALQRAKIQDAELTPSAQVLASMRDGQVPFFAFSQERAVAIASYFQSRSLDPEITQQHQIRAAASFQRQEEIEAADTRPFAEFLQDYLKL